MNRLTPEVISERIASGQYYVGNLCRRSHDWSGTGQSVRMARGCCLECKLLLDKERNRRLASEDLEKYLADAKVRRRRYIEKIRSEGGDRLEEFRRKNIENLNRWRIESEGTYRESLRKYRSSEKGKLTDKRKHNKRRAAKKDAHCAPYSKADLRQRLEQFDLKCAYCHTPVSTESTHSWDHFIPLCRGGPDALGNLVLACVECNSSKKHRDPEVWYFTQPFATKRKWNALLKKLGRSHSSQLPLI